MLQYVNDDEKEILSDLKDLSSEISLQLSDEDAADAFTSDQLKNLSQKMICLIFFQNFLIFCAQVLKTDCHTCHFDQIDYHSMTSVCISNHSDH